MAEETKKLTLRDMPISRSTQLLKWLAALSGIFAVIFISLGLVAEFTYYVIPGEGDTPKELFISGIFETSWSAGKSLFILGLSSALLWLGSKAIDQLNLLVWLKANDEERKEIITLKEK